MLKNKLIGSVLLVGFVSLIMSNAAFALENIPTDAENKENAIKGYELGQDAFKLLQDGKLQESYLMSKKSYTALKEIASETLAPIVQKILTNIKYGGIAARDGQTDQAYQEYGVGLSALDRLVKSL